MLWMTESIAFEDRKLCFWLGSLLLPEHHAEETFLLLVPLEIPSVLLPSVLTVAALEVGTVALDVVEHILMAAQKLGGIGLEESDEPGYLGASVENGVAAEKLSRVVERLQLGECLKIADAQFCHFGYGLCGGLCLQLFVELLHFSPRIDAIVIDNSSHLNIHIE